MARGEITGKKPKQSAERPKREPGPPRRVDPGAIEPTAHGEPSATGNATLPPIRGPPIPTAVFSIKSFCLAHGISESMYFKLREQGHGPREMRLGTRVFITHESAERWRIEREAATVAAE
jgi:hypothetical protein